MAIAAIDYGKRRMGVAACDAAGILVYPAAVIQRRSLKSDTDALMALLSELEVNLVIVGLPLNMDGTTGPAALEARQFARHLRDATGLEIELYDERLSTFEAEERLKNTSRRRRASMVDAVAAMVILESWLHARRNSE